MCLLSIQSRRNSVITCPRLLDTEDTLRKPLKTNTPEGLTVHAGHAGGNEEEIDCHSGARDEGNPSCFLPERPGVHGCGLKALLRGDRVTVKPKHGFIRQRGGGGVCVFVMQLRRRVVTRVGGHVMVVSKSGQSLIFSEKLRRTLLMCWKLFFFFFFLCKTQDIVDHSVINVPEMYWRITWGPGWSHVFVAIFSGKPWKSVKRRWFCNLCAHPWMVTSESDYFPKNSAIKIFCKKRKMNLSISIRDSVIISCYCGRL